MPEPTYIKHPVTGVRMSLNQLADSAGLYPATVCRRYARGERGMALIAPVPPRSEALRKTNEAKRQSGKGKKGLPSYSQRLMSARRLGDLGQLREQSA